MVGNNLDLLPGGYSQVEGVDYDKLFSPIVHYETVRVLLALAALEDWELEALDVKTAFLYGKLDEEIYMEQPEGFVKDSSKVWRLRRSLYGLKQAGLSWWRACTKLMTQDLGFKRCTSDAGIYVYKENNKTIIAIIYIDDALFMGNDKELVMCKKREFMQCWECRDLGAAQEFLGMHIRRDRSKWRLTLDQSEYLKKIIKRFKLTNAKVAQTPLPTRYQPSKYDGPVDPKRCQEYQQVIGSLLYLSLGTRANIAYHVAKTSQHQ